MKKFFSSEVILVVLKAAHNFNVKNSGPQSALLLYLSKQELTRRHQKNPRLRLKQRTYRYIESLLKKNMRVEDCGHTTLYWYYTNSIM